MENEKHFKLLKDDSIEIDGVKLYRIEATRDIPQHDVVKGEKGGYVEKEDNLQDNAWVAWNAKVYGNALVCDNAVVAADARVFENAQICGNSMVSGEARVYGSAEIDGNAQIEDKVEVYGESKVYGNVLVFEEAKIYENAKVCDGATVAGGARVYGDAVVNGNAQVCGNAQVYGSTWVLGDAEVYGNACVSGVTEVRYGVCLTDKAYVKNNEDFCFFYGFGRTNRRTTFFKTKDGEIFVVCGCFEGTLEKFVEQVKETHGDNKFAKEYLSIVEVVKIKFNL